MMSPRIALRLKASWNCRSCLSRSNCIMAGQLSGSGRCGRGQRRGLAGPEHVWRATSSCGTLRRGSEARGAQRGSGALHSCSQRPGTTIRGAGDVLQR